jgi:hypothetical protein
MRRIAAAALLLAACEGTNGTINLDLTAAPGSTLLASITHLRLTLVEHGIVEDTMQNASGGFDLSISLPANGDGDYLLLEGFDAAENLIATGSSPPFLLSPTEAHIVIYVAAPMSIGAAPVALAPARSGVSGVILPYGAVFAGGRDAGGAPSAALAVYNDYDHSLAGGMANPIPRADFAIAATAVNGILMVGGTGLDGNPVSTVQVFDTTIQPAGAYVTIGEQPAFARAGEIAVPLGNDRFLLTGSPPAEYAGGLLAARSEIAFLPNVGASTTPTDGIRASVFVGDTGVIRFREDHFDTLAATGRVRAAITDLPATGKLVIAGGGTATVPTADILLVDPSTGVVEVRANALVTPRFSPAIAATARYVVITGGTDAADVPIGTAEILDGTTLAPIAIIPNAARAKPLAFRLSNGQVLIAGGSAATDLLELFTPPPP